MYYLFVEYSDEGEWYRFTEDGTHIDRFINLTNEINSYLGEIYVVYVNEFETLEEVINASENAVGGLFPAIKRAEINTTMLNKLENEIESIDKESTTEEEMLYHFADFLHLGLFK